MKRKEFIKIMAMLPIGLSAAKLNTLKQLSDSLPLSQRMPVLFIGHGSPMNGIENNFFTSGWKNVADNIPTPKAVLVVSAHWYSNGTYVTAMDFPRTIHDFGGFPEPLYEVQYPAPGNPALATEIKQMVQHVDIGLDHEWGLDHGAWTVIRHMYPQANIPVLQLSIDYTQPPQYHYDLAKQLSELRNKGVLIVGSGNMVHNLRMVSWENMQVDNYGFDWALQANDTFKTLIADGDFSPLLNYKNLGREVQLAVPTPDHYLPLIYTLGLKSNKDDVQFFNDKYVGGSLSMTSVLMS